MSEIETYEQRKKRLHRENQSLYRKRSKSNNIPCTTRHELGRMDQVCNHCGAKFWINEKSQNSSQASPSFAVCCAGGKVSLPPLLKPPSYLLYLYTSSNPDAVSFCKNIRGYNNLLACTSFGANVNKEFQGQGISNFQIHGQVYHCIGSLLPEDGNPPAFAQLYIYVPTIISFRKQKYIM